MSVRGRAGHDEGVRLGARARLRLARHGLGQGGGHLSRSEPTGEPTVTFLDIEMPRTTIFARVQFSVRSVQLLRVSKSLEWVPQV